MSVLKNANLRTGSAALCLILAAACGPKKPEPVPEAWIVNNSGQAIKSVLYRPCDKSADWAALEGVELAAKAGSDRRVELPLDCVDLVATFNNGRTAGTQTGIKRQFPFRWVIY